MRINIYSQELTNEVITLEKKSNTGLVYSAVQMVLHSSNMTHRGTNRSAVTFWLPKSTERRIQLARTFEEMAYQVRHAKSETGLD